MPGLDGLRAFAVLAVVWHHAHPGFDGIWLTRHGFLGVDLFFVLSGLLITTLLLRERERFGTTSLKNFYMRRALRIFPLYYAVLFVLAIYFGVARESAQAEAFMSELPWHAAYLSNWVEVHSMMSISWSLSAEEQFYLLWPPLLVWLGLQKGLALLVAFLVVNQAVNFGLFDPILADLGVHYDELHMLQATFTPILLGVLLAAALHNNVWRRRLMTFAHTIAPWLLVVLLLLLMSWPGDVRGAPRLGIHVLMTMLLAAVVLQPQHRLVRWLEWRPLVWVGTVSYGVYLLHMIGLDIARRALQRVGAAAPEMLFVVGLAVTLVLAGLSYRWFESWFLRHKSRFAGASGVRATVATAARKG
jgi:peptidoglycan/LPS O-acetylase OafA/YrhL